jgi:hypothetical protein
LRSPHVAQIKIFARLGEANNFNDLYVAEYTCEMRADLHEFRSTKETPLTDQVAGLSLSLSDARLVGDQVKGPGT